MSKKLLVLTENNHVHIMATDRPQVNDNDMQTSAKNDSGTYDNLRKSNKGVSLTVNLNPVTQRPNNRGGKLITSQGVANHFISLQQQALNKKVNK